MEVYMSTARKLLVAPLLLVLIASSPAFAGQRHVVDPTQLAAIVEQHVAKQDADRAAIHEALSRPEIQALAGKMGVDLTRAAAAVDSISSDDLARAANAAHQINQHYVGGASTVVISTTTIIIVLLLVVLLVVLLK
jgi:uncharacterized BrkB/YihY/UPF0761 family membrane protein